LGSRLVVRFVDFKANSYIYWVKAIGYSGYEFGLFTLHTKAALFSLIAGKTEDDVQLQFNILTGAFVRPDRYLMSAPHYRQRVCPV
jgi:hypothetical protein